jgi:hypothetical protein
MVDFDTQRTLVEIRQAETADLLDRITAYRNGMEPPAIALIEQELRQRGIDQAAIDAHAEECRRDCTFDANGIARSCSCCRRPAVTRVWRWRWLWDILPLFRRLVPVCREHR